MCGKYARVLSNMRLCAYGRHRVRKSIARSANTGISCVLNQRGDILQPTQWWTEDVFASTIYKNDVKTFMQSTVITLDGFVPRSRFCFYFGFFI
jgi:hypothetical protein